MDGIERLVEATKAEHAGKYDLHKRVEAALGKSDYKPGGAVVTYGGGNPSVTIWIDGKGENDTIQFSGPFQRTFANYEKVLPLIPGVGKFEYFGPGVKMEDFLNNPYFFGVRIKPEAKETVSKRMKEAEQTRKLISVRDELLGAAYKSIGGLQAGASLRDVYRALKQANLPPISTLALHIKSALRKLGELEKIEKGQKEKGSSTGEVANAIEAARNNVNDVVRKAISYKVGIDPNVCDAGGYVGEGELVVPQGMEIYRRSGELQITRFSFDTSGFFDLTYWQAQLLEKFNEAIVERKSGSKKMQCQFTNAHRSHEQMIFYHLNDDLGLDASEGQQAELLIRKLYPDYDFDPGKKKE